SLADDGAVRANWAVPWSDLMMTMFVLFAVLLAVQTTRERVRDLTERRAAAAPHDQPARVEQPVVEQPITASPARGPAIGPAVRINVFAQSQEAVRKANLQNAEIVIMDDQSVKVSVQGPTFFAQGKADLRPEVTQFLDGLARIIKQTPYEIHV